MNSDDKFCAALVLANSSDRLSATVVANAVAALVQELKDNPEEEDCALSRIFDAVRAIACALFRMPHEQHVGAVVAGGTVAVLSRVLQCTGSQRVKNEATIVLNMISEAERSRHNDKAQTPT